jgi:hypothetical protein
MPGGKNWDEAIQSFVKKPGIKDYMALQIQIVYVKNNKLSQLTKRQDNNQAMSGTTVVSKNAVLF